MLNLRISKYLQEGEVFMNVNYNILPLVNIKNVVDGELESRSIYENYDPETKTGDLVVKEHITYTRVDGYLTNRLKIIERYNKDDTVGYTKKMTKYYTLPEATSAGKKQRDYKMEELKINTIGLIAQTTPCSIEEAETLGVPFIMAQNVTIGQYIEGASQGLIDAITSSTLGRMDNDIGGGVTIRNYMINYLG